MDLASKWLLEMSGTTRINVVSRFIVGALLHVWCIVTHFTVLTALPMTAMFLYYFHMIQQCFFGILVNAVVFRALVARFTCVTLPAS
jgi:hypothetical protein